MVGVSQRDGCEIMKPPQKTHPNAHTDGYWSVHEHYLSDYLEHVRTQTRKFEPPGKEM